MHGAETPTHHRRRTARAASPMARPCPRGRESRSLLAGCRAARDARSGTVRSAHRAGTDGHDGVRRAATPAVFLRRLLRAGTARCATRGCRQVFGLGTRSEKRAKRSERRGVTRFSLFFARVPFLLPGSLPRRTAQCHDPFVSHTAAGQRRLRTTRERDSYRLPFSADLAIGTDEHNIVWLRDFVNAICGR
ncbi:hypothetical protein LC55x_1084 [Lysobacter capsici]|uniref:Uncharacterized protein n=1 Tax=Lysobacter capsici AZ78 TaxID=1444315 RepID=A0A108U8E0_9GAMM|nr:hypothetical protein LC55x_1084 [Lysobacter capsici]KWS04456.1 hypothetical protein AZ78_2005 [Lysobacter capsici AZ78]